MIRTLSPESIKVNGRHRADVGDIDVLARSIADVGLLHPIVVTTDNRLICGHRRLLAVQQLGWLRVDVRTIDPDDLLRAEYDENEVRKDFTPSERVAIAREIEERIGKRQGRRTDSPISKPEHPHNDAEVEPGQETRDVAARKAGFVSRESYRRAAKVVDDGIPELVEAVDSGRVSVSAAAEVADLPREEQAPIVQAGPAAIKAEATGLRRQRARKNPLSNALQEIGCLLGSVKAADDDEEHGWGGFETVYREMDASGRHHVKEYIDYVITELQEWAKIARRIDSKRGK